MTMISKDSVTYLLIDQEMCGQRLDNFLLRILKGVPKSHIYRIIRAGEVRINKRRCAVDYRVQIDDIVRVPPIRIATEIPSTDMMTDKMAKQYRLSVIYEDDALLVVDKPAGLAVHGGSGIHFGLIELIRKQRPDSPFLELVHRLDRETSGLILIAKKRSALVVLHQMMRDNHIDKRYMAMVAGTLSAGHQVVKLPLFKYVLANGERRVRVAEEGQFAHTIFNEMQQFMSFSLLEAQLKTGRTHQIRVHLAHLGLPILGDDKYGDFALNKQLPALGLKRMFLHAGRLTLLHPLTQITLRLEAPLPPALQQFLDSLA